MQVPSFHQWKSINWNEAMYYKTLCYDEFKYL